jgi:hypothetical protein
MGMVALLGQLSQPQDFEQGVSLIRHAADNADENAPQGAYVCNFHDYHLRSD